MTDIDELMTLHSEVRHYLEYDEADDVRAKSDIAGQWLAALREEARLRNFNFDLITGDNLDGTRQIGDPWHDQQHREWNRINNMIVETSRAYKVLQRLVRIGQVQAIYAKMGRKYPPVEVRV
jgi:broad specificity phosphatase PhoE